jgi:hypothetical protein
MESQNSVVLCNTTIAKEEINETATVPGPTHQGNRHAGLDSATRRQVSSVTMRSRSSIPSFIVSRLKLLVPMSRAAAEKKNLSPTKETSTHHSETSSFAVVSGRLSNSSARRSRHKKTSGTARIAPPAPRTTSLHVSSHPERSRLCKSGAQAETAEMVRQLRRATISLSAHGSVRILAETRLQRRPRQFRRAIGWCRNGINRN